MLCAACAAEVPDDDLFCENCGVKLVVVDSDGCSCGAALDDVDEDGFCFCCGRRVRRPATDHIEECLGTGFAAVSDRGQRHERNEDRFALVQVGIGEGIVVCDGVSSTSNAEVASAIASERVASVFQRALRAEHAKDSEKVIAEAVQEAATELRSRTDEVWDGGNSPSTTLVAALVVGAEITVGWVGDSRAYWIDEQGARLLTEDHSWMRMVVEAGTMSQEEAEASPEAHAITRWLGADAEDASSPDFVKLTATISGTLLLCTDGLWNYAPAEETLAALVRERQGSEALSLARALVSFANEQGGRDNITVAALRIDVPLETAEPPASVNQ